MGAALNGDRRPGRAAALAAALALAAPAWAVAGAENVAPAAPATAADEDAVGAAPARAPGEGRGPFRTLVIRSATIIDGTGAPPRGPYDIVIAQNRIVEIRQAGWPGLPAKPGRPPHDADLEIDASGMYVLPGFVDTHVHAPTLGKAPDAGYAYKLWLAHGVTTVRGVPLAPAEAARSEKARSQRNEIAAPRILNYQTLGAGWSQGPVTSPAQARAWVRWAARNDIDGIKFFNGPAETPAVIAAAIDEAHRHGMGTVAHLAQTGVARLNAAQAGELGLDSVTHFYGHMESLLRDATIQDFPASYDYNNEQDRFGQVAEIWRQTVEPGSDRWRAYLAAQQARGVEFDPTFNIYAASRDLMRARNADWHATYTMPRLWSYFQSTRDNHGSYFYDWTSENEVAWKRFYGRYLRLVNDYKNVGGRVTVGTDSGFIYKTYGFSYVEELEFLREAGFTPLEVFRSATLWGAEALYAPKGVEPPVGTIAPGKLADLVITPENPLQNLKTLLGVGHQRLNPETNRLETVGGVRFTIKDGIVYDAPALLRSVAAEVEAEKRRLPPSP